MAKAVNLRELLLILEQHSNDVRAALLDRFIEGTSDRISAAYKADQVYPILKNSKTETSATVGVERDDPSLDEINRLKERGINHFAELAIELTSIPHLVRLLKLRRK